jgi:hypothetical protein
VTYGYIADLHANNDIRPTMLSVLGLRDDYPTDGRVLAEDLSGPTGTLGSAAQVQLAQLYKQLNSSVGQFGTDTPLTAVSQLVLAVADAFAGDHL